jgi:oxygen-independent coproporphyrinogen-3 oxidase
VVKLDGDGLTILPHGKPLTRMIARAFDAYDQTKAQHSAAI